MLQSQMSSSATSERTIKLKPKGQMIRLASSLRPTHQNAEAILDSQQNKLTMLPQHNESRNKLLLKAECMKMSPVLKEDEFNNQISTGRGGNANTITLPDSVNSNLCPSSDRLHLTDDVFAPYSPSSGCNSHPRALLPVIKRAQN